MSKSDADAGSRIELIEPADSIVKKIRRAVTDSQSLVTYSPEKRPGVATLVDIECACSVSGTLEPDEAAERAMLAAMDTGTYKQHVADVLVAHLAPIRAKYMKLMDDRAYLRRVLDEGARKAHTIAAANYSTIVDIMGTR